MSQLARTAVVALVVVAAVGAPHAQQQAPDDFTMMLPPPTLPSPPATLTMPAPTPAEAPPAPSVAPAAVKTAVAVAAQPPATTLSIDEFVNRISRSEAALMARMRAYHPLVEVYVQNLPPDPRTGTVPIKDEYFLGQFDGQDGPKLTPLSPGKGSFSQGNLLTRPFATQYLPDGFAATTVPDWRVLD